VVTESNFGYAIAVSERDALQFAIEIARIAHDNKSEDVVALDLRSVSPITDYVVIATGTSDRQMRAVADMVVEYGRKLGERPFGVSGVENAAWILLDYVDVVFHLFNKPYREYYDLELLWGHAPRLEWARSETA
jgi:ribosome-associated protein